MRWLRVAARFDGLSRDVPFSVGLAYGKTAEGGQLAAAGHCRRRWLEASPCCVTERLVSPGLLHAPSALTGSITCVLPWFATAWLTWHHQDRCQQAAQEGSFRRRRLHGDHIGKAAPLYADALGRMLEQASKLVPPFALRAKPWLPASPGIIDMADVTLRWIVETCRRPTHGIKAGERFGIRDVASSRQPAASCRNDLRG